MFIALSCSFSGVIYCAPIDNSCKMFLTTQGRFKKQTLEELASLTPKKTRILRVWPGGLWV